MGDRRGRRGLTATLIALVCSAFIATGSAGAFSVGGHGVAAWPYSTLQLGVMSLPGEVNAEQKAAPLGFRYAYLSGGVNTGEGWSTWAEGGGSYVSDYIAESEAANVIPVFSYYQLRQSAPGDGNSDEVTADLGNLENKPTMLSYYNDLKLFFQQSASATGPVVLQVEPDMWGYIEGASKGNAANVGVSVASSGMPDLQGLANNASGLAQAILVLRNNYAPKVIVAYHDSSWGTGLNIQSSHPTDAQVVGMAATSVGFYRSLHAKFNAVFTETSDRDAGYAQNVNGEGTTQWWSAVDFQHLGTYVKLVHKALGLPMVIWQIPVGMTSMNNTSMHYADNKVQSLLDSGRSARALLRSYAQDGVSALLFGPGQSNDTQVGSQLLKDAANYYNRGAFKVG